MACGLTAGWNVSDLEKDVKPCPDGFCYKYEKSETFAGKAFGVERGCGRVSCYALPYQGNISELCEVGADNTRKGKNVPTGPPFNQQYTFINEHHTQTGRLQYCDSDRCNSQPTHFAVDTELEAEARAPYYCVACKGPVNGSCGVLGASEEAMPTDPYPCHYGYCFTYVWAEGNKNVPTVWRGCGPLACKHVPGAVGSIGLCDDADKLQPVDTSNGDPFNKIRSFSARQEPTWKLRAGSVQYCKAGNLCNYQSVRSFPLKNLYQHRTPTVQEVLNNLMLPDGLPFGNTEPSRTEATQMFHTMDKNGDGVLEEAEFSSGVRCTLG
ncbi:uncharacterized protein LOC129592563 [Paramacrobiotus metropolitanus]|uniref:uncharacterized protein LOC129592563 n=1 Tax=Paramacrobiotus metropolitanus TaxID=2943436 RepID=UPI00244582A3|nr:uncharacterized protein LOC129592563 [Paramacrobiotus metropolitanus]